MSLSPDCPAHRSGTDLGEHLSLLRRRWLLLLGCILAGGTAGLAMLRLTPPAYTATAQVLVTPVGTPEQGNQVTNRQREALNLDTEAQIARSSMVAAMAAKAANTTALEPAEVSVPPNAAVLLISVTAADPETAVTGSQAYAQAYLAHRAETAQAAISDQLKVMLTKLRQVNTALSTVVKDLDGLRKGAPEHTLATQRQSVLNRQVHSLTLKYDALRTLTVTPGSVISPATPPQAPSSPGLPLFLGSGLMAGLLLGAAAAAARDRLDTRLRSAADVERLTGLPALADLSLPDGAPHDLACSVVAACPGKRLLVRAVPAELGTSPVTVPLATSTPLSVLDGTDVGDLAKADAALLLIGLGAATSVQVAAAVRHLSRHNVPIIGAVTTTDLTPAPVPAPRPHTPLGKLVATGELQPAEPTAAAETTPQQVLPQPPGRPA
ncbi:Wzz/FepE/Etk N-terminal domain-containing protein [Nonomuraea sp. LPB2021202275-12-8]|uniref:Wzz/FepE/Etk N-terminal domain-containing protein n=1 Tax=Nonomuraea sp. LPB2021202275-12-8 TaxID=3120159 RepID=UPI00300D951F